MARLGSDPTSGGTVEEQTQDEDDTADDQTVKELKPDADGDPMREQTDTVDTSTGPGASVKRNIKERDNTGSRTESTSDTDASGGGGDGFQDAKDQTRDTVSSGPSADNQPDFATQENPTPDIDTGTTGMDGGPADAPTETPPPGAPDTTTPSGGAPDQGGISGGPGSDIVVEPDDRGSGAPPSDPPSDGGTGGGGGAGPSNPGTPEEFDASGIENTDKEGADTARDVEQDALSQYDYLDRGDVKVLLVDREDLDEYGIDPSSVKDSDADSFFVPVFSDPAKQEIARRDIAQQYDEEYQAVDIDTGDITLSEGDDGGYSGNLTDDAVERINDAYFGGSDVANKAGAVADISGDESRGAFSEFTASADLAGEAVGDIQAGEARGEFSVTTNAAQDAAEENPDSQAAKAVGDQVTRVANQDFAVTESRTRGRSTPGGAAVPGPEIGMGGRASDPGTPRAVLRGGEVLAMERDLENEEFTLSVPDSVPIIGGREVVTIEGSRGEFEAVRDGDSIRFQQVDEFEPQDRDSPYTSGVLTFGIPTRDIERGLDSVVSRGRAAADTVGDLFIGGSAQSAAINPGLMAARQFGLSDAESVEPDATARLDVEGDTTTEAVENELAELSELSESTAGTRYGSAIASEAAAIPTYPFSVARAGSEGGELVAAGIESYRAGTEDEFTQSVGERAAGTAALGASTAAARPYETFGRVTGSLVASAGVMGAAAAVGPRAGTAARWSIQPGEEALGHAGFRLVRSAAGEKRAQQFFPNKEPIVFSEETVLRGAERTAVAARRAGNRAVARGRGVVTEAHARAPRVTLRSDADVGFVDVTPGAKRQFLRGVETRTPNRDWPQQTAGRVRDRVSDVAERTRDRARSGAVNRELDTRRLIDRATNIDIERVSSRARSRARTLGESAKGRLKSEVISAEVAAVNARDSFPGLDYRPASTRRGDPGLLSRTEGVVASTDINARLAAARARSRARSAVPSIPGRSDAGMLGRFEGRALGRQADIEVSLREKVERIRGLSLTSDQGLMDPIEGGVAGVQLSARAAARRARNVNVRERLPETPSASSLRDLTVRVEPGRPPRRVPASDVTVEEPGGPLVDTDFASDTDASPPPLDNDGPSGGPVSGRLRGGPTVEAESTARQRSVLEAEQRPDPEAPAGPRTRPRFRTEGLPDPLDRARTRVSVVERPAVAVGSEQQSIDSQAILESELTGEVSDLGIEAEQRPRAETRRGPVQEVGFESRRESRQELEAEFEFEFEQELESELETETELEVKSDRRRRGGDDESGLDFFGESRTIEFEGVDPLTGE